MSKNKGIAEKIESILFVNGDGIAIKDLINGLNARKKSVKEAIEHLKINYSGDKGIHLIEYADKIQFCSNPDYSRVVDDVLNPIREKKLSNAMLEALAIIAYKQPVTRLDIENIRGVSSDYVIQNLLKHNMIEVIGRKDSIGKPMLFGTTDDFLKRFDLKSIEDLPSYDELIEKFKVVDNKENQSDIYRRDHDINENNESNFKDDNKEDEAALNDMENISKERDIDENEDQ